MKKKMAPERRDDSTEIRKKESFEINGFHGNNELCRWEKTLKCEKLAVGRERSSCDSGKKDEGTRGKNQKKKKQIKNIIKR